MSAFVCDPAATWCPECLAGRTHWRAEHEAFRAGALKERDINTAAEFQSAAFVILHACLLGWLLSAWLWPGSALVYLVVGPVAALIVWLRRGYYADVLGSAFPVLGGQFAACVLSVAGLGWLTALVHLALQQ